LAACKTPGQRPDLNKCTPQAPGIEVIDEIADIQSGATQDLTVTLEAGHYALICNIREHYSSGMWADLTVT